MTLVKTTAAVMAMASLAYAAHAADDLDGAPTPRRERPVQEIFLSPAGEPFRTLPGQVYPLTAWFSRVDLDHDGRISRAEFRADFEQFFKRLDENHDGVIDSFEIDDYEHKIAPEILSVLEQPDPEAGAGQGNERHGRRDGAKDGANANAAMRLQMQGAAAYSLLSITEPVAAADANLDGKITLDEFRAAAERRFDLLDAKHLGYLTLDALPRTPAQIAESKRKPEPDAPGKQTPDSSPQAAGPPAP